MHNKKEKSVFYSLFFFLEEGLTRTSVCYSLTDPPSTFKLVEELVWVLHTYGKSFADKLPENPYFLGLLNYSMCSD